QLISFNGSSITKQVFPSLSSITVFTEEMGIQAVELINSMIQKTASFHPRMIKFGTELTIRESSF
ncbi:substrate-binding domain-containing protein, partial [Streptomyces turgidiscabies]|uniref:substrate-binding domain-containing protein n=1 Tax=Streptomyces turgidiscabies TaxID=85558 RepID=UPI0038F69398